MNIESCSWGQIRYQNRFAIWITTTAIALKTTNIGLTVISKYVWRSTKKKTIFILILGVKYEPIQCLGGSKIREERAKLVWELSLLDFFVGKPL